MGNVKIKFTKWWHYLSWKRWVYKRQLEGLANRVLAEHESEIKKAFEDQLIYGACYFKHDESGKLRHIPFREVIKEEIGEL